MAKNYGTRADGSILTTQWETILYYLQTTRKRITSWEAIKEFGFTRLAAIVKEIEYHTGIVLKRESIPFTTRFGASTNITEYWYEANSRSGKD